jgi:hypothetical protein
MAWEKCSDDLREFIESMLLQNYKQRPVASALLDTPFMRNFKKEFKEERENKKQKGKKPGFA